MKFLILALVAALPLATLARAEEAKPAAAVAAPHAEAEAGHKHKHGKKCGHPAEKHGDHTDFHHEEGGKAHHHKAHDGHYDECEGPEGEAKADAKTAEHK